MEIVASSAFSFVVGNEKVQEYFSFILLYVFSQICFSGAPDENVPTVGDQMPVSTPKKRRPYHGWICDAEDHDPNDLVDLIPDSLSESLNKLLRVRKNRLPRWDVMPQEA